MTWRTVSEVLDAEYVEATRVSPLPADQAGVQALAARPPVRVGGTNYLSWLHVRLFLDNQSRGEAAQGSLVGVKPIETFEERLNPKGQSPVPEGKGHQ